MNRKPHEVVISYRFKKNEVTQKMEVVLDTPNNYCMELDAAISQGWINFGGEDGKQKRLHLIKCIIQTDGVFYEYLPITNCPYCGRNILCRLNENERNKILSQRIG
jgi:hypothetical protein